MKIAAAQINTRACDIAGNVQKIASFWQQAEDQNADLVVTPEQSISGYPLEDTALNPDVLAASQTGFLAVVEKSKQMKSAIVVGLPEQDDKGDIYNVAYLVHQGKVQGPVRKRHLPNYDVFDEKRIYTEDTTSAVIPFKGMNLGILICEDLWHEDVAADLKTQGADLLIAPNASPFYTGKHAGRIHNVLRPRVRETGLAAIYVNQVGGQDEIVFDGYTTAMNADGTIAAMARPFEESLTIMDVARNSAGQMEIKQQAVMPVDDPMTETYKALVQGTRDYLHKIGMTDVVLGMSGGIDSALVAAIAVDALGPEHVHLVKLPSRYSSDHSITDADEEAALLGADIIEIPIEPVHRAFTQTLAPAFNGSANKTATDENLQARIRGTLLMALSNEKGWLVLSTGNKSEVSIGYCTLYGDMNGGFNPLKDVWKMDVYALSKWRNKNHASLFKGPAGQVIPQNIIEKEPSAELGSGQKDSDTLPPYPVLDEILKHYIEREQSVEQIAAETGFDSNIVKDMIKKVDLNEFKRQQACPGIKITQRNFGKGRRVPIARPSITRMKNDLTQPGL